MQRRLYFVLPDIETTHNVVDQLLRAHISEDNLYVVARDDAQTRDLPEAGVLEQSDVVTAAGEGAAAGGVTGVLAGLTAMAFPPIGIAIGGGVVAATGLAGAGFGAWMSSMIGISKDHAQIEEYETAIENGRVLMMVDVPEDRVQDIEQIVKETDSEAEIAGTDPNKPSAS